MRSRIRVAHVLRAMNRGGVETWLMHVLRHADRNRYQMDFLVQSDERGVFDDEIEALGSRVISCGGLPNPARYAWQLQKTLRRHGPYDIVHSHPHCFSGLVVRIAAALGVPVRIAHSHSDRSTAEAQASPARRLYLAVMKEWIRKYATVRLGGSGQAAADLFGEDWQTRSRLLSYGIDLAPFRQTVDSARVRQELGIKPGELVIGHVGRFSTPKNHIFLLEVASEFLRRMPSARFLLVGDGPLRAQIEGRAQELGIAERLIFPGPVPDAALLLKGAMDVFLFPSLYEGLPLSLLEAQAAGLPCVISDVIDPKVDVVPQAITRVSLNESPEHWAAALESVSREGTLSAEACCMALDATQFSASASARELTRLYADQHITSSWHASPAC